MKKRRTFGPDLGGALPGSRMGSRERRQTGRTPALGVDPRIDGIMIAELARFSLGRVLLHFISMLGDRAFRFHAAGMMRELSWGPEVTTLLAQVCTSWQQAARACNLRVNCGSHSPIVSGRTAPSCALATAGTAKRRDRAAAQLK